MKIKSDNYVYQFDPNSKHSVLLLFVESSVAILFDQHKPLFDVTIEVEVPCLYDLSTIERDLPFLRGRDIKPPMLLANYLLLEHIERWRYSSIPRFAMATLFPASP